MTNSSLRYHIIHSNTVSSKFQPRDNIHRRFLDPSIRFIPDIHIIILQIIIISIQIIEYKFNNKTMENNAR